MTQLQSDESQKTVTNKLNTKNFADFWHGMFFLISTASLFILMLMFFFIWQPIWTEGFKDFHTISTAIDKLDKTAKPASDTIPLMLKEMQQMNKNMHEMNRTIYAVNEMNKTMYEMQNIMQGMSASLENMEVMTPDIKRMSLSIEQMSLVLSAEMPRISYLMGRVDNKMPNMDFMPFN